MRMRPSTWTATVLLLSIALAGSAIAGIGPGPNEWQTVPSETFGISSEKLTDAANELADAALFRYCTLVVKDGYLIHEQYHYNNSESLYESDSMGKTAVASVIGLAVYKGLLDIDRPVIEYGVDASKANWSATGVDFFPQLTTRHILSQATGYGRLAPGSYFTYDSDQYIQYLSYVLTAVTGEDAIVWATREFAEPMGIPQLFIFDDIGGDISAGGGQMYTCKDAARIGQLVASGGIWADAQGNEIRFFTEEFARDFFYPSFPKINSAYGFLLWLNRDVTKVPDGVNCCAPRWGHASNICTGPNNTRCATCCKPRFSPALPGYFCDTSATNINENVADEVIYPNENPDAWMTRVGSSYVNASMVGDNFVGVFPAPDDMGVAMGWAARYIIMVPSQNLTIISMGVSEGWAENCWGGYDDSFTLALVWNTLGQALQPNTSVVRPPLPPAERIPKPASPPREAFPPSVREKDTQYAGSCSCTCSPGEGFGRCFNVQNTTVYDDSACQQQPFYMKQMDYCAQWGLPKQCRFPEDAGLDLCANSSSSMTCVQTRACAPVAGINSLATAACACSSPKFGSCSWSNSTCDYTPYFPPGMAGAKISKRSPATAKLPPA